MKEHIKSFEIETVVQNNISRLNKSSSIHAAYNYSPVGNTKPKKTQFVFDTKIYVILISLISGLFQLSAIPFFLYQKDELKLSPNFIQSFSVLVSLPYCFKPVFGYIFDNARVFFKKTKQVIIICAVLRILMFSLYVFWKPGLEVFIFAQIILGLCSVFENITSEYILIIMTKQENQKDSEKRNNKLPIFFGFRTLGTLIGNFFSGRVVKNDSYSLVFFICTIFSACLGLQALIFNEQVSESDEQPNRSLKEEIGVIVQLITSDGVISFLMLIVMLNLTPSFDVMTTFYFLDYLKFSNEDLADFATFGSFCYIVGLISYSYYFYTFDPKCFYIGTNFAFWGINSSLLLVVFGQIRAWGFSEKLFCLANSGISTVIGEINFMPIIAIWCEIIPKNLEATSITLMTGIVNFCAGLSAYLGVFIMAVAQITEKDFSKFWILLVVQNVYLIVMTIAVTFSNFPKYKGREIPQNAKEDMAILN